MTQGGHKVIMLRIKNKMAAAKKQYYNAFFVFSVLN